MSDKKVIVKSGGISATSILGGIFVYLKLTDQIDWSWFWVTSPFWIPIASVIVILSVVLLGALVIAALKGL